MADYFPVLSRAVAGLENNTAEARRAVYERARAAIVRQLRAIEPPLPEEDIARERMQLEEAIRKIEANAGAPVAPRAVEPSAPKPPAPTPPAPRDAPREAAKAPEPVKPAPRPAPGPRDNARPAAGESTVRLVEAPRARPATRADGRPIIRTPGEEPGKAKSKRSGPLIALGALAVIAVGAGAFAARDQIAGLLGGSGTEIASTTTGEPTPAPAQPEGKASDKSTERAPQQDAAPPAATTEAPPAPAPQPPAEQEVARAPEEPAAPAPAPAAEPPAEQQPPAAEAPQPGALVAQRAVLYEEGPNQQSGEALNGAVVWRTESVGGGQGQQLETALRGDIDIPGRKLGATLTIRRNLDTTLPASHTIEIQFKLPENFPNAGVANVPGLLMKADEAARGAAVAGLSVRVMNGFFLIGLSNLETEKSVNEQLLRDRGWIDIPILYDNGRRAVLTLEKGTPGTQAFNDAFSAWRSASAANQSGGAAR